MAEQTKDRPRRSRDDGASAVEYGLIVVAIAAAVVLIVVTLGQTVNGLFDSSCDEIAGPISGTSCS
jgi:pilus assembly protein Flp/PilA